MKLTTFCYILPAFVWISYVDSSYANNNICTGQNENIECLKMHFEELTKYNNKLYSKILRDSASRANECVSIIDVAGFIGLANINVKNFNAEFNEYYGEVVENMVISKTLCFFDALLLLDDKTLKNAIYSLKHPLFVNEKQITDKFKNYKTNKKYSKIINLYFSNYYSVK